MKKIQPNYTKNSFCFPRINSKNVIRRPATIKIKIGVNVQKYNSCKVQSPLFPFFSSQHFVYLSMKRSKNVWTFNIALIIKLLFADQRCVIQKNQTNQVCIIHIFTTAGVQFKLYFAYLELTVVRNIETKAISSPLMIMITYTYPGFGHSRHKWSAPVE